MRVLSIFRISLVRSVNIKLYFFSALTIIKHACEGNPTQRTKPGHFRIPRKKGFDPEVEFGGEAKVRGISRRAASKKNWEAPSVLCGPDLVMHRAKNYYYMVKSHEAKQKIVEKEQA